MKLRSILNNKIAASASALALTLVFILWDYFHDGVPTHHLLADENLPGFSNWWGILTIPLLTWIVITLIQNRNRNDEKRDPQSVKGKPGVIVNFFGALIFGLTISIFWEFRFEGVLQYLILLPLGISFFRPVHFPENLLGFVLGMLFTFGGILPIIVGLVLLLLCWIINKVIRKGILLLISKIH